MKTSSFQANVSSSATWGMVITEADLWMLLNPLQVQIKSITTKPCFLHQGIVFSNLFPVCLQMHICTSLYNYSLKKKKKIKIEVYHLNGSCGGKYMTSFKIKFDFTSIITHNQHSKTCAENLSFQCFLQKKKNRLGITKRICKKA